MALARPAETAPDAVQGLRDLHARARPVALAGEQLLPVVPALAPLLPDGLRRGATVTVSGGPGATSLLLAVVAGPSAAGSWCAAVGMPSLGLVAAAEAGVALERFPVVPRPSRQEWPVVVAALLDGVDVVLACPPPHLRGSDARRLAARARERGAVLVVAGGVEGADVRLTVTAARWDGLDRGHGHLTVRRLEVVACGRGAAARERRASLWLPAGVTPVDAASGPGGWS